MMCNKKNVIIGIIYRDPNKGIKYFNDDINECLEKLSCENKNIYIMGDFNIDLLNGNTVNCINDYVNIIYNNSFRPLIDRPTRITTKSTTLIDNILTNVHSVQTQTGIFYNDITDHLPIFQITSMYPEESVPQIPICSTIFQTNPSTLNYFKKIQYCLGRSFIL